MIRHTAQSGMATNGLRTHIVHISITLPSFSASQTHYHNSDISSLVSVLLFSHTHTDDRVSATLMSSSTFSLSRSLLSSRLRTRTLSFPLKERKQDFLFFISVSYLTSEDSSQEWRNLIERKFGKGIPKRLPL